MIVDIFTPLFRPAYGGVENATFYLAQELAKKCKVRVYTLNLTKSNRIPRFCLSWKEGLPEKESIDKIEVLRYPFLNLELSNLPLRHLLSVGIQKALRATNADVVHIQGFSTVLNNFLVQRLAQKRVIIITPHGLWEGLETIKRSRFKTAIRWGIPRYLNGFDHIIVTSNTEKGILASLGCSMGKVSIIPNGVNLRRSHQRTKSDRAKVILSVARFAQYKGHIDLIKAIRLIRKTESFRVQLVGNISDYSYYEEVKNLIKHMDLDDVVSLKHSINDSLLAELYSSSDIFVLPSRMETSPLSIREAMSAGLPVIATNLGSIHEMIKDGVNGYLIRPGDIEELANRLSFLLKDEQLCNQIGRRNKLEMEQYSWQKVAEITFGLYLKLIEQKRNKSL